MPRKQERDLDRAMDILAGALVDAVRDTIAERSPEPARELVAEFEEIEVSDSDGGSIVELLMLVVLHFVAVVREELAEHPDRVEQSLAWVQDNLGTRCRLRARCVSPALRNAGGEDEITEVVEGLGPDFIPSIIWLLSGATGSFGGGGAGWLRGLHEARLERTRATS
jgi:hypothetical protein